MGTALQTPSREWFAEDSGEIERSEGQESHLLKALRRGGASMPTVRSILAYHESVKERQPLGRTLLELGAAQDTDVAQWIAQFNRLAYLSPEALRSREPSVGTLPEGLVRSRLAIPLAGPGGSVTVALSDPLVGQFSQVRYALEGTEVEWVVAPHADVVQKISDAYDRAVALPDNEVERFVEDMLREAALTRGVSDIHCVPAERTLEIKWRIDGRLVPWRVVSGHLKEVFVAQVKLSSTRDTQGRKRTVASPAGLDVSNRLEPQDASSVREYGSKRVALRYSVIPALDGESIVIRLLDQAAQVGSVEELGMHPDTATSFRQALTQKNGLILLSGPTGHGKSTTLAAAAPSLTVGGNRVLSVEDPVEYRLRNITQVSVSPRVSWAGALKAFLRHNPDVVILGEIRDAETAELAVRLALTGHLILATVHATSSLGALARMTDLGVPGPLLAGTVRLLVGQRLLRRLCPQCRRTHARASSLLAENGELVGQAMAAGIAGEARERGYFEPGGGCAHCARTGFVGRTGIFEIRPMTRELSRRLCAPDGRLDIASCESDFETASMTGQLHLRSLRSDGVIRAFEGLVSVDDVVANTRSEPVEARGLSPFTHP